jgi:dTDP-4-dehydrorhamnose 3,5-epimerase
MEVELTPLEGAVIINPMVFTDHRGYFFESFNDQKMEAHGLNYNFIQDNESLSHKGVLRGLHYQIGQFAQTKLVRVIRGSVLDVIVDLRPKSQSFGQHFKLVLSETNKTQLLVPRGFAHGFLVLEDNTVFSYKCDNFYNKVSERGIIYNDAKLNIDWGMTEKDLKLSEKDLLLGSFENAEL